MAHSFEWLNITIDDASVLAFLASGADNVRKGADRAIRAALNVVRKSVMGTAPTPRFRLSKSYLIKMRGGRGNIRQGRLSANRGAGLIQTGAKEHYAPVTPSMVRWMEERGFSKAVRWGSRLKKYVHRVAMRPRPWIGAAAAGSEAAASTAFEESIIKTIEEGR